MNRSFWIVPVLMLATASLLRAEQVENPEYAMWKAFGAGAASTLKMKAQFADQPAQEMTMRSSLKSIDDQGAVLNRVMSAVMNGQTLTMPGQDETLPATIDAGEVDPLFAGLKSPDTEHGQETIQVNGQSLECTWYVVNGDDDGTQVTGKIWLCEQVPGKVVRMEGKHSGSQGEGTMHMELVEFVTGGE